MEAATGENLVFCHLPSTVLETKAGRQAGRSLSPAIKPKICVIGQPTNNKAGRLKKKVGRCFSWAFQD